MSKRKGSNSSLATGGDAVRVNSAVIAASIVVNTLYAVFTEYMGIEGITALIMLVVYGIGIVNLLFHYRHSFRYLNKVGQKFVLFELFLLMAYVLTLIFSPDKTTFTFMNYLFYCFLPPMFLLYEFDTELILRYGMYISLLSIFGINTLLSDHGISIRFAQASLGVIYDLLPCVVISLLHFCFYRKGSSKFVKLCYLYYIYVFIRMIMVIVRGALFTLLVGGVLIYINRPANGEDIIKKWSKIKKILVGVGFVVGGLMIANYEVIIDFAYNLLDSMGIELGVITKFHFYISIGNATDNREPYYELVSEMFKHSPIWGNGILTFYAHSADGIGYPHNFILQFLFEGGLILAIPLTLMAFREVYRVILSKYVKSDDFVLSTCFILLSIIPGLFSMNIWQVRCFWLALVFGFSRPRSDIRRRKGG